MTANPKLWGRKNVYESLFLEGSAFEGAAGQKICEKRSKKLSDVAAERMAVVLSVVRKVGEGFVHCIVGVSWEVWPHAMSVIVIRRVKRLGAVRRALNGYPKGLLVKFL